MKPSQSLVEHRDAIRNIVKSHGAQNARVFGSAAKGTDTEGSDLDILVDPAQDATLFDIGAIRSFMFSGVMIWRQSPNSYAFGLVVPKSIDIDI